jgi:limonene-1,2-epoxide hydrolase
MSISAVIEGAALRRRTVLALLASAALLPMPTHAQDNAALNDAAKDAVTAFLKALRNEDMDAAMQFVGAPFVAEDAQIFATEAEVKAYLTEMCMELPAAEMPNEVFAILDYDQSRAATAPAALKLRDTVLAKGDLLVATGRNGLSRGVLLVKANGGKPVVVGVGY